MIQATYLILISGIGAAIGSVLRFGCLELASNGSDDWGILCF
ncbi:Uncharacterised protein [Weissella viridescens]|uniref:Uncharacterized protein n=1 Tax=Weissella viridescens TaxID=1629 RepID=A0A380P7S6_WEIVI|nr:Uncharacterised protein [Weissella viridescens]